MIDPHNKTWLAGWDAGKAGARAWDNKLRGDLARAWERGRRASQFNTPMAIEAHRIRLADNEENRHGS